MEEGREREGREVREEGRGGRGREVRVVRKVSDNVVGLLQ